jgi:hypothetical protein
MDKSLQVNLVERQTKGKFLCKHAMLVFHFQMPLANYLSLRHDFYHVIIIIIIIIIVIVVVVVVIIIIIIIIILSKRKYICLLKQHICQYAMLFCYDFCKKALMLYNIAL